MRYNAFISYSHQADSAFARAFQRGLEQLARPWNRRRALDIFRDETDLSISPELLTSICEVADQSSYFLLLASPLAATSKWVGHEVEHWASERGCRNLLIILTDGDLVWDDHNRDFDWNRTNALPQCLRGKFSGEPFWVDFRWAAKEPNLTLKDERFCDSVATVAAELHGMSKRDLVGEDLRQHQKFVRVKRIAQASGTVLLLGLVVATWFALQQRRRAEQRRTTVLAQQLASDSMRVLDDQPALIDLSLLLAAESMKRQPLIENNKALRRALSLHPKPLTYTAGGNVRAIAFSSDSRIAATAGQFDGIEIVELSTGRVLYRLPAPPGVSSLALSPHGELAAAGDYGVVGLYDVSSNSPLRELPVTEPVADLAFSPDGNVLAVGVNRSVRIFETRSWTATPGLRCDDDVRALAFSDGQIVAIGNDSVIQCSGQKNARVRTRVDDQAPLGKVSALSADGQYRVTCGHLVSVDKNCRVSDLADNSQVSTMVQQDLVDEAVFSPDSQYVATTSRDHSVRVFESSTGEPVAYLRDEGAGSIIFSPDGRYLAAGLGGRIRFYQLSGETMVRTFPRGRLISAAFSADGRYVAHGGTTEVFEVATGRRVLAPERARGSRTVALSPDGRFVAADGPLTVLELNGGREVYRDNYDIMVTGLAFSSDGRYLAIGTQRAVDLYDLSAGKQLLDRPLREPRAVSISADGKYLAAAGRSGALLLFTPETRELLTVKHQGLAHSVALTPDGRYLASGGTDQQVPVYDIIRHRELCRLIHQETVYALAFSPDGRYIATGGLDKSVRIFSLPAGDEVARLPQEEAVIGLLFEPDGRHVLTAAGKDRSAGPFIVGRHLLQPADLVQEACSRVSRNLSRDEWARWVPDQPFRKTCPALP
jgi:WD40 repeat protein